jgi:hypothetical protein
LASSHLDKQSPTYLRQRKVFVDAFLAGYVGSGLWTNDPVFLEGSAAGEKLRKLEPGGVPEVLGEYGYKPITAVGAFSFRAEEVAFVPTSSSAKDRWWLMGSLSPGATPQSDSCRIGTVTGYLSPQGVFGHLNGYKHELIVSGFHCDG